MKRILIGAAIGVLLATGAAYAESYRVTVTRKDSNLYRVDGTKTYIQTKYCYEYSYSEEAILNYTRGSFNNKLIFDKRPTVVSCEVDKVLTED